jgi:hypothetical protein
MSNTQSTCRLYLEGLELDLEEDSGIAMTFEVDSIKDISVIASNYTKTIKIPGTTNNNRILNWAFNPHVSPATGSFYSGSATGAYQPNTFSNFDFKRQSQICIIEDNQVVLAGYGKLLKATSENGMVSYELQVTSTLGSLISTLSNLRLEDIPATLTTAFSHLASIPNITGSWNSFGNSTLPYLWPIADYGQAETCQATNFYVGNLRPGIYIKAYWDLIFKQAGFTYSSSFLNSPYFGRFICPWKDGVWGPKTNVQATYSGSGLLINSTNNAVSPGINTDYIFNEILSDPSNQYNPTQLAFFPTASSIYEVDVTIPIAWELTCPTSSGLVIPSGEAVYVTYEVYSGSTLLNGPSQTQASLATFPNTLNNWGPFVGSTTTGVYNLSFSGTKILIEAGQYLKVGVYPSASFGNSQQMATFPFYVNLTAGSSSLLVAPSPFTPNLFVKNTDIIDYSVLNFTDYCMKDVQQVDFILSVCLLFNLFMVQDRDNPTHFNIFTRQEFYQNQSVVDWTNKLDTNSPISITPLPSLSDATLFFSYKEDKDYFNDLYTQQFGGIYGQNIIQTFYQFTNTQKKVLDKMIFSPTPMVQYDNDYIPCENTVEIPVPAKTWNGVTYPAGTLFCTTGYSNIPTASSANPQASPPSQNTWDHARVGAEVFYWNQFYTIVSCLSPNVFQVSPAVTRSIGNVNGNFIATNDTFVYVTDNNLTIPAYYSSPDLNVTRKPTKTEAKILYYNGIQSCNPYILQYTPILTGSFYTSVVGNTNNAVTLEQYPYCSHLIYNPPLTSSFQLTAINVPVADMNFAPLSGSYFPKNFVYPTNNFFNLYWADQVDELVDNEAVFLEASFKLNSVDIATLNFQNIISVDNMQYRLNSIKDYSPDNNDRTTEIELIKLPYRNIVSPIPYVFQSTGSAVTGSIGTFNWSFFPFDGTTVFDINIDGPLIISSSVLSSGSFTTSASPSGSSHDVEPSITSTGTGNISLLVEDVTEGIILYSNTISAPGELFFNLTTVYPHQYFIAASSHP